VALLRRAQPSEVDPADLELKPSVMRGSEAMYGYMVGFELVVVAVLELTVTTGKGAPAHPPTALAGAGLAVSLGALALLRFWKNRTAVAFAVIAAALVVDLPTVPDRLAVAKLFAVFIPLAYGLILIRRQTRSTTARQRAGVEPKPAPTGRAGRKAAPAAKKPIRSGRYTPPKAKREEQPKRRWARTR
jgi:hypothetical protein